MSGAQPSQVVVAGAGTGKTYALVKRYLEALFGLDPGDVGPRTPDRILAITFTDKAASEMRGRVQRRLAALLFAVRTGDASDLDELERDLLARAAACSVALPVSLLEALRRSISTAPLLTFHAFCARLLREHAIAAGLDPGFALLEPDDERRLLLETAEAAVLDALPDATVAELCARISLRGFGDHAGLVECLVDVYQTLGERGLSADALALAAPPEHALEAVEQRLRALGDAIDAMSGSTAKAKEKLTSIKASLSAVRAAWLERDRGRDDDDDAEARIARAFGELRSGVGGNWGSRQEAELRRAVVAATAALGAALVDAFTRKLAPAVRALVAELAVRAAREKDARGVLGFGDLLVRARDLLRSSASVRASVKARVDRVLVDEYQDTSPAQEDILALLLEEPDATAIVPPGTRPLDVVTLAPGRAFLVGDAKQSIYSFRGADPTVLLRALARVGERSELSVNRRSRAPIVALANLIADHALPRGPRGTDRAAIVPLSAARGGEGSPGEGSAGEQWLVDASGAEPDVQRWPYHEQEASVVALRLRALFDAGELLPRDVCVLVRRGQAAVGMARALGAAGISAVVVGGDGFYRRPEVSDVLSALTLAIDPTDELSVLAVLRSPLVAVPDDQILALYEMLPGPKRGLTWPRALSAADDEAIDEGVRARVRAFDAVLQTVRQRIHQEPLARAVDAVVDGTGYAAACAIERDGALRLANLEKLRALCDAHNESAVVALTRLAAALDDPPAEPLATVDDDHDARGRVRVMTIHQAKGLEFPAVVLADASAPLRGETDDVVFDVDAGLAVTARGRPIAVCVRNGSGRDQPVDLADMAAIQRVRRHLRDRGEAELARLLYVAVTRARDRLFVAGNAGRSLSLLKLLDVVRAADAAQVDALLPRVSVTPARVPASAPLVSEESAATGAEGPSQNAMDLSHPSEPRSGVGWGTRVRLCRRGGGSASDPPGECRDHRDFAMIPELPPPPAPVPPTARRVHASEAGAHLTSQVALPLAPAHGDDARTTAEVGQLAHGVLALVAGEEPDLVLERGAKLDLAIERAARALGVADVDTALVARLRATLAGPLARLVEEGYTLAFEEALLLRADGVVVEGRADLVARSATRTLVVDFKLGAAAVTRAETRAQLLCYAGALAARGEPGVAFAAWAIGDDAPAPPHPFGTREQRALDDVLAHLRR